MKEQFNASVPSEDIEHFAKSIAGFAEKMTTYAGSASDPGEYGKLIAARLCPDTLPYELGTSAAFEVMSFNGRALGDDALDVMLMLATNTPLVDGLAADRGRIRKDFPYYGAPYTAEEQVGVRPMPAPLRNRREVTLQNEVSSNLNTVFYPGMSRANWSFEFTPNVGPLAAFVCHSSSYAVSVRRP